MLSFLSRPLRQLALVIAGIALTFALFSAYNFGVDRTRAAMRPQVRGAELAALNAEARADSTRVVYLDSLRLVERRAQQVQLERDRADEALRWERKVRADVVASIPELIASAVAAVREDSAVRSSSFHIRQVPYTVDLNVSLPPAPDSGTANVAVAIDTANITVGVGCDSDISDAGTRAARVAVEGPPWLPMRIDSPAVTPDVCSADRPEKPASTMQRLWTGLRWAIAGGAVVAAVLLGRDED